MCLGFFLDRLAGCFNGQSVFPTNPKEWTLKHWSHHGELASIGVPKDPGNFVYYVMFQILLKRVGDVAADEERDCCRPCDFA